MLSAERSPIRSLSLDGPFAMELGGGEDNLVMRATEALAAATGMAAGVALRLDKRLPVASGIGGGSADAAATLRLLMRLWGRAPKTAPVESWRSGFASTIQKPGMGGAGLSASPTPRRSRGSRSTSARTCRSACRLRRP